MGGDSLILTDSTAGILATSALVGSFNDFQGEQSLVCLPVVCCTALTVDKRKS